MATFSLRPPIVEYFALDDDAAGGGERDTLAVFKCPATVERRVAALADREMDIAFMWSVIECAASEGRFEIPVGVQWCTLGMMVDTRLLGMFKRVSCSE